MPESKQQNKEIECINCHQFKTRDQFYKDRAKKDGIRHLCKTCQKIRVKDYKAKWAFERATGQIEVPTKKECKVCNQVKPVSEFSKHSCIKDGIDYICKACKSKIRLVRTAKWKKERDEKKIIVKSKTCIKCLRFLPISHFTRTINIKDGHASICRACYTKLIQEYKRKWMEDRNRLPNPITEKICASCNRRLPVSSFYFDDYSKDGLRAYCIECVLTKAELRAEKWSEERENLKEVPKEKSCNICFRILPITEFYHSRRYRDGLWPTCKNCFNSRREEYAIKWEDSRTKSDEILVAKQCNVCMKVLPTSSFTRNKKHKDGLFGTCKKCMDKRDQGYIDKWESNRSKIDIDFTKPEGVFASFEKKCITCQRILPITFFNRYKRRKDGHFSQCKDCSNKIVKKSRERIKKNKKRKISKEKLCIRCKRILPSDNFIKDIYHKDGLATYCKECNRKREKEYRNRPDVKKRLKEKKKLYDSRPEVVKRKREYSRKYARRPDVKKRRKKYNKEYRKRPGVRARLIQYNKDYRKRKKAESNT